MKYKKTNFFSYANAHIKIKKHEQINNNKLKNVKRFSKRFKFDINKIKNISKKNKSWFYEKFQHVGSSFFWVKYISKKKNFMFIVKAYMDEFKNIFYTALKMTKKKVWSNIQKKIKNNKIKKKINEKKF